MTQWFQKSEIETASELGTNGEEGLSHIEVKRRLEAFGVNAFELMQRKHPIWIFLAQFKDLLIGVLFVAAVISLLFGEWEDSLAILSILILNGLLGFVQEFRAERAMEAIQKLATPQAKVKRQGQLAFVPAHEIVPGDVVLIESGNLIPADLRLIEAAGLQVNESTLTGESIPVDKFCAAIPSHDLPITEQKNIAFKGTLVSSGRGIGIVVRTGMKTELGKIAQMLQEEESIETPLQRKISRFAKHLATLIICICVIIFIAGLWRGEPVVLMFLTALSLAVAAIPEALPAVVSIALALGAREMSRKKALVRKLSAVESLGAITYICSDKTGTLTENRMSVKEVRVTEPKAQSWLFHALALNNDATLDEKGNLQGDPTETALLAAAMKADFQKFDLERKFPRMGEIPFTSERRMMSTVHQGKGENVIFTKGAPESVFKKCSFQLSRSEIQPFHESEWSLQARQMANLGYRVLGVAFNRMKLESPPFQEQEIETGLTFLGLVGLIDPPREQAKEAIEVCRSAGIHPVMITGDHPDTARVIAQQIGLFQNEKDQILTGSQLTSMTDEELKYQVKKIGVYARVAPEQKIRIVKALQTVGEVVAMTGDGVNDAPALKRADIGIAMGKGGTDVAREASHLILLDDNFATIVSAIRQGRRIYDNIRKFIRFSLSGNSGELWTLFLAPFIGLPTPLQPIQILWINLITDGLPGIALAFEPEEKDTMHRPPRHPNENIFARGLWQHCLWVGLLIGGLTLGLLAWAYSSGNPHWQSIAFTTLGLTQMGHVLAIRSERESLWSLGLFSNPYLIGSVAVTIGLQLMALYLPGLNRILKTNPLNRFELLLCFSGAFVVLFCVELEKEIRRRNWV